MTVRLLVLGLTLLAFWIRLPGLVAPDGSLNTDEARLALAADGVLQHGWPVLPSGRVYTRGLLNSYLMAPSFALLGRHDFAARLPSVVAGALLVPVVFLLGRALGGQLAGLAAALFVTLAEPLVYYSRSAWLPSIFLLLFILAIYGCWRGFVERRPSWQIAGAIGFLAALLSYEFAVLLLVGLGVLLGSDLVRGDHVWWRGRPTAVALGLLLGGVVLLGLLALTLRSGTLAGPLGEVRTFLTPSWRLSGLEYYWRFLLADYAPLVALALLGLVPLARCQARGTAYLLTLALAVFLVPCFVVQVQRSPRYALPVLPLLAIVAAAGAAGLVRALCDRVSRLRPFRPQLQGLALSGLFALSLRGDVAAAARLFRQPTPGPTWVQSLEREQLRPTDLIVAESANKLQFYFGRAEFYLRPENYERYAYRAGDTNRYIYTDSVLLLERGDFERLVEAPNPGRTVWVVGRADRLPDSAQQVDGELWPSLLRSAERQVQTPDGWLLVRLTLPRR